MEAIFHIGRNTFRECLRQPIYIILLLTTLTIIGIHPMVAVWFTFRGQEKLVVDGSVATIMLFGWIMAVLAASHTIDREIETGTVLLIFAKPVSRSAFIIAKIIGIISVMTLFVWVSGLATMIGLRMATDQFRFDHYLGIAFFLTMLLACIYGGLRNYFSNQSFPAAAAKALGVGFTVLAIGTYFLPAWADFNRKWGDGFGGYNWNLARELVLIMFAVWAMAALATALSTRFNLVSNLTICAVIFIVGLMSDYFYKQLLDLKLEQLEKLMHSWFFVLIPFVLFGWVLSLKHYHMRKDSRVKPWEVHTAFGLVLLGLLGQGVHNFTQQVYLEEPAGWMKLAARFLFTIKNASAEVLYAMIPNWQKFWLVDAVAAGKPIPAIYIACSAGYIAIFISMFVILAVLLFANREVGAQSIR